MEILDELKKQLDNSMKEINDLSKEIESYSQIKDSLKSANSKISESNDTFDMLATSIALSSNKLKDAAQSIEAIAETLTKLDTVSLQLKLDQQIKDMESLKDVIMKNFKILDDNLSAKIDNSTIVGRFFKK